MRTLVVFVLVAVSVQSQPVASESAPCTYDECAIRIESRLFGGASVVRGPVEAGVRLGRVGVLLNGLEVAVADVPVAADHARTASRYRTGALATSVAGGVAVLLTIGDLFYRDLFDVESGPTTGEWALYTGGLVLTLVGSGLELKAQNEMSRAVWEYNRATGSR